MLADLRSYAQGRTVLQKWDQEGISSKIGSDLRGDSPSYKALLQVTCRHHLGISLNQFLAVAEALDTGALHTSYSLPGAQNNLVSCGL